MLRVCTAHFSMRPSFPAFKKEAKQKNSPTSFIHQPTIYMHQSPEMHPTEPAYPKLNPLNAQPRTLKPYTLSLITLEDCAKIPQPHTRSHKPYTLKSNSLNPKA